MSNTYHERPKRTNAPMQPKNGETTMELKQCVTCGASSFTNGKCDYCGNQYEMSHEYQKHQDLYDDDKHVRRVYSTDGISNYTEREIFWSSNNLTLPEPDFQETLADKLILKIMIYILVSIIWFAITVFIPPLFIITIILLVIYCVYRLTKRNK